MTILENTGGDTTRSITGRCLCGAVTYSASTDTVISGNCHCVDCKKASGSGYAPTLFFPQSSLTIHGEVKFYASPGKSGLMVQRGFCPTCGSQLFGKPAAMPGMVAVRAGSLDDLSVFKPTLDLFTSHAPAWDAMNPDLPKFAEMPPHA